MIIESDKLLENALRDGLREGIKSKLTGYNGPFDELIKTSLEKHQVSMREMIHEAMQSCIGDAEFRQELKESIRHTLAKTLVQRFGGELEKQVNTLKSDPTTRARITLAIEEIVKSKTA